MNQITGRCFCGAVSYSIAADAPLGSRACWCRGCQKIASGSATVNALFPEEAVTFDGPISTIRKTADSGNTVERGFCKECGSQIFSRTVEPAGDPIRIRVGTLDDPEIAPPTALIWVESAPSWAALDPKLPWYVKGPKSALVEREG